MRAPYVSPVTIRSMLVALVATAIVVPLATLRQIPTPFPDVQLYASIALARLQYGVGIPTISWNSPAAVDHIPFYGPVFFDLSALSLRLFGVSLRSFRLVSILGTGLYLTGCLALARQFTRSRNRMLLAAALVLTTPEVNFAVSTGAMHMLAVGFEVLALATFVKNFDRRRGGAAYGAATGVWLALAALTTPRSYPFIFAFVCAGVTPSIFGTARRAIRYRFGMAMAVFAGAMIAWAFASHGGVVPWARYLAYIFTHEDTDVAVLPTAVRTFSFHWSGVLTPLAVIAFGVAAAWAIGRRPPVRQTVGEDAGRAASRNGALAFLIACAWIALITTAVVLNYTFFNGEYIALPMLAVLVAWPWSALPFSRRTAAIAAGTLMCLQLSLLAYRYTCLTVRWQAQEPEAINAFVQQFVPAGSTVAGPEAPYFFPVERAGSRYRTVSPRSWADWARWVPIIEPEATRLAARTSYEIPTRRFLIWPAQDDLPDGYACAAGSVVAQYQAAEASGRWPDWLVTLAARFPGYPSCVLYRLPPGCPTGYDPTMPPGAVSR